MSPHIVALTGMAGSGKSTAAGYLASQFGFRIEKFAGPLKDMLRAIGLSEEEIEGEDKHYPSDILLGRTPRHAMQTLGTDWGRKLIGEDFWVQLWKDRAVQHRLVVVDDCRFLNEAQAVHELGGRIIRIHRPHQEIDNYVAAHASEQQAKTLPYDFEIANDGSPLALGQKVYHHAFKPVAR